MKTIAGIISALALAGSIAPAILFQLGRLDLSGVHLWMLVSTVAWFAATPVWMRREDGSS